MDLEVFRVLGFFFLLGWAAMYDFKIRKIPDILTCLLWFIVILSLDEGTIGAMACAFVAVWFCNLVFLNVKGKEFWGWGDVLIFAPFFAQLYAWGQPILATMALITPSIIGGLWNKKEEAIAPYLLLGAILAFFFGS
jgi:prepilin signal peptidase PulO-like enzyme (type II secretory pathway)